MFGPNTLPFFIPGYKWLASADETATLHQVTARHTVLCPPSSEESRHENPVLQTLSKFSPKPFQTLANPSRTCSAGARNLCSEYWLTLVFSTQADLFLPPRADEVRLTCSFDTEGAVPRSESVEEEPPSWRNPAKPAKSVRERVINKGKQARCKVGGA